ncbi:MAG: bifunctional DNA primase/polymerase [Armatimonadota bacterium]
MAVRAAVDQCTDLLERAVAYAQRGVLVLPLEPRGKRPHREWGRGVHDATRDPETIRAWWSRWPQANIGGAVPATYVVLDVDGPEGETSIADRHLPHTVTACTGGGGLHYWFRLPQGVTGRNLVGFLPGIDLKAAGGYVVLPPSIHPDTDQPYAWADMCAPGEVEIAEAPAWVVEVLSASPERQTTDDLGRADVDADGLPEVIYEGTRNTTLFRHGCRLRGRGADAETILDLLLAANVERCEPPLPAEEVRTIARSASRYPVGPVRVDNRVLNADISDGAKLLGALLALTQGRLTQEQLAELAGASMSSIKRWRKELRESDLLTIALDRPNRRYTLVCVEALLNTELSTGTKVLYMTLAQLADDGETQVGQDHLGARCGMSRSTIFRGTEELVAAGLVERIRAPYDEDLGRRSECNRYRLPLESESPGAQGLRGWKGSSVTHSYAAAGAFRAPAAEAALGPSKPEGSKGSPVTHSPRTSGGVVVGGVAGTVGSTPWPSPKADSASLEGESRPRAPDVQGRAAAGAGKPATPPVYDQGAARAVAHAVKAATEEAMPWRMIVRRLEVHDGDIEAVTKELIDLLRPGPGEALRGPPGAEQIGDELFRERPDQVRIIGGWFLPAKGPSVQVADVEAYAEAEGISFEEARDIALTSGLPEEESAV